MPRPRPAYPAEFRERIVALARVGRRVEGLAKELEPCSHLADFLNAYDFARRLPTPSGLTPYAHICKIRTSESERFIADPIHQMPGLDAHRERCLR